jgi:hypothetical protein
MSKFAESLTLHYQNKTSILHKPLHLDHLDVSSRVTDEFIQHVFIGELTAVFRSRFLVKHYSNNKDNHREAVYNLKQQLVEELFSEFRPQFYEIKKHIYAGDEKAAIKALDLFYDQMFESGLHATEKYNDMVNNYR